MQLFLLLDQRSVNRRCDRTRCNIVDSVPGAPNFTAKSRISTRTPPLLQQYAANPGKAIPKWTELMLIMHPGFLASRNRCTNAYDRKNGPRKLTAITLSKFPSVVSQKSDFFSIPALLRHAKKAARVECRWHDLRDRGLHGSRWAAQRTARCRRLQAG